MYEQKLLKASIYMFFPEMPVSNKSWEMFTTSNIKYLKSFVKKSNFLKTLGNNYRVKFQQDNRQTVRWKRQAFGNDQEQVRFYRA